MLQTMFQPHIKADRRNCFYHGPTPPKNTMDYPVN